MSIEVVCECGFHKEVPDHWKGVRVTCKCGRSFVISSEGGIQEPPIAAAPQLHTAAPSAEPTARPEPAAPTASENVLGISTEPKRHSVAARYRARNDRAGSRKRLVLFGGGVIALVCLGALAFVMRDRFPSLVKNTELTKTTTTEKQPAGPSDSAASEPSKRTPPTDLTEVAEPAPGDMSELSDETGRLDTRIAEALELEADDGLLLTGMLGDVPKQLDFSEEQSTKIEELTNQLKAKGEDLVSGAIPLEQWYIDGDKIGKELLAAVTDPQRTLLRELIEREQVTRVRLEEYAAKLRPELSVPIIAWKIEPDGVPLPAISASAISGTTNGTCLHTVSASGALALASGQRDNLNYELWDLATDKRIGGCKVTPPNPDDITLVAQGGRAVVRGGTTREGQYRVQAWSVDSDAAPLTKMLPRKGAGNTSTSYQLVDCVANRVLCVSDSGYWVWNLDSDKTMEVPFSDWVPHGLPKCAISPGGRYVAMAHRHSPTSDARQYHFVEVGIYELETGELLGNQVLATDYQPLQVAAIAFSYDGHGLALLWDIDSAEPKRVLLHLSASMGELIRTADELPPAKPGYAWQHNLLQRDLIWLPDNSGWVVNLQSLVDAESGAAIAMELPKLQPTAEDDKPVTVNIIDAIPAGNNQLLLITTEPAADDPSAQQVKHQFMELPDLSPFL